jgi:predicted nucleic acid-binding protein
MTLVVDASIAAAWMLPDEQSALADAVIENIGDTPAFVPALFWFEIRNLLIINERRRLDPGKVDRLLSDLADLGLAIDTAPSSEDMLGLARRYGLTVYDAAYLELALRRSATLATLDGKLATAASEAGIALFGS